MGGISHIGIVVKDLDKAIDIFTKILDCEPEVIKEVKDQKIKVAIFKPGGQQSGAIELICPYDDNLPIKKFIEKHGEGLHHLSMKVTDIAEKLNDLTSKGVQLIDKSPRTGAEGRKIAFVHPRSVSGVLLELEEE